MNVKRHGRAFYKVEENCCKDHNFYRWQKYECKKVGQSEQAFIIEVLKDLMINNIPTF